MTRMMELWRQRTGPQRFETYTRWTLYVLLGFVPLLALAVVGASDYQSAAPGPLVAYGVLITVQTLVAIVVIRQGITAFRDGAALRRGPVAVLLILTAATVTAALLALPEATDLGWAGRGAATLLALAVALFAVTPVLTTGVLVPLAVVASVVSALVNRPGQDWPFVVSNGLLFAVVMVAITPSFRISVWMLGVVWEQERTRQLHARLAVAEERLRFSRDLHDVVGRTLSAVSLKSELAAELARRGSGERAAEQMDEVRELAGNSLREVRAVVAGYRRADLPAELAGARSMLRSAGVRTRVVGEDASLPRPVQSALAWVVREGVTNVVRHADAAACTIDLEVHDDVAQVTITNDGARGAARDTPGSGLLGLSERLNRIGGTITAEASGANFTLRARVPLAARDRAVDTAMDGAGEDVMDDGGASALEDGGGASALEGGGADGGDTAVGLPNGGGRMGRP